MLTALIIMVLMIVIPLLILFKYGPNVNYGGRAFMWGMFSFFISQLIIRIPLMSVLNINMFTTNILLLIIIPSFTAGIFEETGRLIIG